MNEQAASHEGSDSQRALAHEQRLAKGRSEHQHPHQQQNSAARAAASREARTVDAAALAGALAGASTHDASCADCGRDGEHAAGRAAKEDGVEARAGVHDQGCACAGCASAAAAESQPAAAQGDVDAECPGLDVSEYDRKVLEAAEEAGKDPGDAPKDAKQGGGDQPPAGSATAMAQIIQPEGTAAMADAAQAAMQMNAGFLQTLTAGEGDIASAGTVGAGKPAGFPGILGLTSLVWGAYGYPDLKIDTTEQKHYWGMGSSTWDAAVQATTSTDAVLPCVAAPADEHKTGERDVPDGKGGSVKYDVILKITPDYNAKIVKAEQEHLDDMGVAYNLSLVAAAAAVNSLVGTKFSDDSDAKVRDKAKAAVAAKLHAKLTADPATWRTVMRSLGMLTITGRDNLLKHTFGLDKPVVDKAAKKITTVLNDGSTDLTIGSATMVTFAKI